MIDPRIWAWIQQPCEEVGCTIGVVAWEDPRGSLSVQHGPNPEHRTTFNSVTTLKAGQSNYLTAIRDWLTRVHAPWEPAESDDASS